jgi:malate permease and related proteins
LFEIERKRHPNLPTVIPDASIDQWWMTCEVDMRQIYWSGAWIPKLIASILLNPIILAIVGGILFSLSGWKLPLFLNSFCTYTGDAVTPMAAFAIGVFACRKPSLKFRFWASIVIQVVAVKFFLMPLLVMPFLLAFGIVGIPRQMGVLMAALPIALSSYVLSVKYNLQVEESAMLIIVSTVLMLPTQIMWIGITTSMGW